MSKVTLEKINNEDFSKMNEEYASDCRHLKRLMNGYFYGTEEQRFLLLKNIEDLENEFCNLKVEDFKTKDVSDNWNNKYSSIKFSIYKACGYVSSYRK